jgi:hypothetical protein
VFTINKNGTSIIGTGFEIKNINDEIKASIIIDTSGDFVIDSSNHNVNLKKLNVTNPYTTSSINTLNVNGITTMTKPLILGSNTEPYARFGNIAHIRQIGPLLNDGSNSAISLDCSNVNIQNISSNTITPLFTIKNNMVGIATNTPKSQFDTSGDSILGQTNINSNTIINGTFNANGRTNILGNSSFNFHSINGIINFNEGSQLNIPSNINLNNLINSYTLSPSGDLFTFSGSSETGYYSNYGSSLKIAWGNFYTKTKTISASNAYPVSFNLPNIFNTIIYSNIIPSITIAIAGTTATYDDRHKRSFICNSFSSANSRIYGTLLLSSLSGTNTGFEQRIQYCIIGI